MNLEKKRENEIKIIEFMVKLYCKGKHGDKDVLCDECRELLSYAVTRTQNCPFMKEKTFCSACKVHCYKPEMREKIKEVMKYSVPRMIFYHPLLAAKHSFVTINALRKSKKTI